MVVSRMTIRENETRASLTIVLETVRFQLRTTDWVGPLWLDVMNTGNAATLPTLS